MKITCNPNYEHKNTALYTEFIVSMVLSLGLNEKILNLVSMSHAYKH